MPTKVDERLGVVGLQRNRRLVVPRRARPVAGPAKR